MVTKKLTLFLIVQSSSQTFVFIKWVLDSSFRGIFRDVHQTQQIRELQNRFDMRLVNCT